jgi:hypothetical protein
MKGDGDSHKREKFEIGITASLYLLNCISYFVKILYEVQGSKSEFTISDIYLLA